MTSLTRIATSLVVAGSVIAGQAAALSSDASARDFRGDRHRGESHRWVKPAPRHHEPRYSYGHQRRDRTGDAVAATILGLGAVIIGSAIADAHRRKADRYDDRYDD